MINKVYTGKVISNKMDKTVVVAVTRLFQHPVYKKTVKKVSKFKAHDEENRCKIGDDVKITETRPLSKDKRWLVLEIMGKAARSNTK
ncbi:MAG: 30S ribosomal protein S17 [Nitrospirae bacterium]|nr:30S ribosomal protein S17 [Nitrospirota bacterium]